MTVELAERLFEAVNAALRGERSWVGLGLESVPGKPFGWAWSQERMAIRTHLARRDHRWNGTSPPDNYLVSRIQDRLHRQHPSYRDRQEAWTRRATTVKLSQSDPFTAEELERIVEHFEGANDPVSAAVAEKARRMGEVLRG